MFYFLCDISYIVRDCERVYSQRIIINNWEKKLYLANNFVTRTNAQGNKYIYYNQ